MSTIFDNDILIHYIAAPGLPGDGFTAPEAAAMRSDMDTMLGRPVITKVADIPDVVGSPADGQVLAYDAGDDEWNPVNPPGGITVQRSGVPQGGSVENLNLSAAFNVSNQGGSLVAIWPVWGGTGTADSFAHSDHTHNNPLPIRVTTAPSGYMSGGSRSLGSTSVTLTNGITYIVEAEVYGQLRGADAGAAYYTLSVTIDGNTYTSPGGSDGFWCVQGVPDKISWRHERSIAGTGASVPVSASIAWHSGSGLNVDRMYLQVRIRPNR